MAAEGALGGVGGALGGGGVGRKSFSAVGKFLFHSTLVQYLASSHSSSTLMQEVSQHGVVVVGGGG